MPNIKYYGWPFGCRLNEQYCVCKIDLSLGFNIMFIDYNAFAGDKPVKEPESPQREIDIGIATVDGEDKMNLNVMYVYNDCGVIVKYVYCQFMFVFKLLFVNAIAGILHVMINPASHTHFDNGQVDWMGQSVSVVHDWFILKISGINIFIINIDNRVLFFMYSFMIYAIDELMNQLN